MIDSAHFLPNHDDRCYAYDADAHNDRKYSWYKSSSRSASLLKYEIRWNFNELSKSLLFDQPNSYIGNAYVAWARFRPVKVLRQQLKEKFHQMIWSCHL